MIIKQFPRLYTLDSKNKIRIFDCEVHSGISSAHSYTEGSDDYDNITIRTKTGLLNGKLIEQVELVKKGKQNRTTEEQAIFQAESLWKAKFDEGYKTHQMLAGKLVSILGGQPIYEEAVLSLAIKNCPEFAYTNSNWDELCQLAHKFKDVKKPNFPYLSQPKLNGVRCLVKRKNIGILLMSRGGTYYKIPHIEEQLANLYLNLPNLGKDILLDGELYYHGRPLQEISGAARTEESGLFASNNWLEYHIYDVIDLNNIKESQEDRWQNLCSIDLLKLQLNIPNIKIVNTQLVYSNEEVGVLHDKFVEEGYEGLILRSIDYSYEFNQRSKGLLKVKNFQDEEFEIIGGEIDPNKSVAESFVFILRNNINNLTFKARPTGTNQMKQYWYVNLDSFIGKKATVRFFDRTNDGLPSHGNLRSEKTKFLIEHIREHGE